MIPMAAMRYDYPMTSATLADLRTMSVAIADRLQRIGHLYNGRIDYQCAAAIAAAYDLVAAIDEVSRAVSPPVRQ